MLSLLRITQHHLPRQEIKMNRYFFHVASKGDYILDTNGREFSDLASAHRHAMVLIRKMVSLDDMDWRGWSINVTDVSNRSVLSVLFPQMSYLQCRESRYNKR
jgi:hypothetical protein